MMYRSAKLGLGVVAILGMALAGGVRAEEAEFSLEQIEFFEKQVRPLLVEHCQKCHGATKPKGELRLDSREALLKGGDTGPALVPGKPDESEIIKALRYDPEGYQMPPDGKLPPETVAVFVKWVEMGAPWPASAAGTPDRLAATGAEEFARRAERWSFQPLQRVAPPVVKNRDWARTPIDRFLLAKLEEAGLAPVPETDRRTWIRRVYFDTIGLPPAPEAVAEFVADASPDAFEKVVDRLLASPRFGERWGRHWLDLARYAESRGHEFDADIPNPWHYRDYVIRALNDDLPYDQFVVEHMAGDLGEGGGEISGQKAQGLQPLGFPAVDQPSTINHQPLLATGFWYLGEWVHSPVDIRKDETDRLDNMIEVYGKAFLGLTISCARCHDHKFDPISQKDYYALAGYLKSTSYAQRPFESLEQNRRVKKELRDLSVRAEKPVLDAMLNQSRESLSNLDKVLLAAKSVISAADGRKELFAGFESGEYGEWKSTGDAFGERPQSAQTIGPYQGDVKPQGTYFINSHQIRDGGRGDDHVGRLLSPKFTVVHDTLNFLVGGGTHAGKTCVNLLIEGKVVLTVTGRNSNVMASVTWDLKPFDKRTAQIEIVDEERGGWGNIAADHFVFQDERTDARPSDEEWIADFALIHEVDETLLRHWVKHLRHAATDPLDPFHEWARYAVGVTLSYDEVIARMSQRAKQYRDQFGFLDSDPPYFQIYGQQKFPSSWKAIVEANGAEASATATTVTPTAEIEPEPKTDVIAILSQDGTSFSLPNDEYTPSTEKSLFSDPDYVEEYWTQTKERYWLSDDPVHPIAAVASKHESRVDPDFAMQQSAEGTMTDGGPLGSLQRSGRTLRTASFEITTGKLFAWMRGGAATYVVVDSHALVLGPLHGNVIRKHPAEDRWRWVEHDVSRYVGHQAHLEFVPEANSNFAVSRVLQRSTAPADGTAYGASADLLDDFDFSVNFRGCSLTPGFQATEASVAGAFGGSMIYFPSYQLRYYMQSHPELFALDSPEFQKELALVAKPFMDERQKLLAQIRPVSAAAPAMLEGTGVDETLLIRGNSSKPGEAVPRRFIEVFHGHGPDAKELGSGRLDLARQMIDPAQTPLVPRVIVNRIWHHYFGRGIVATPDDFGHMGQLPTHPELLDWLATELVREEWSQKQIHRVILLSAAYRMGAEAPQAQGLQPLGFASDAQPSTINHQPSSAPDPNNLLLHRMNIKRLEGEVIRDALFELSGRSDDRMFGPSVPIALNAFQDGRGKPGSGPGDGAGRRSIYLSVRRNFSESFLSVFDLPNPHTSVGRRSVSNVPAQALALLNSPMVVEQTRLWGERLCRETPQLSTSERIDRLYELAFSRLPTGEERDVAIEFVKAAAADHGGNESAPPVWADLCHVLLNAKEFIYIR